MREQIRADGVPAPAGAYSQGIRVGDLVFLAGQGPFTASGERAGETFAEQARLTFENLAAVAAAAGTDLSKTVRLGVYLQSMDDFDEFNRIAREYLAEPFPARTTLRVDLRGFDIELDAVVAVEGPR
jgi:reactive intermediate/imine deaminase